MATQQYPTQNLSHTYSLKDDVSLKKWKPEPDSAKQTENTDGFDCNICLGSVQDPVITLCGHLYCWPCIYKWIHYQTNEDQHETQCPVCKSPVSQQTLVPLYGRGQPIKPTDNSSTHQDLVIPKRPLSPRCGVHTPVPSSPTPTWSAAEQRVHGAGGYTTMGAYGETVYGRVFGNSMRTLYSDLNTNDLVGSISSPRFRRYVMETDKSLSRLLFFLCCCTVCCLLLF